MQAPLIVLSLLQNLFTMISYMWREKKTGNRGQERESAL